MGLAKVVDDRGAYRSVGAASGGADVGRGRRAAQGVGCLVYACIDDGGSVFQRWRVPIDEQVHCGNAGVISRDDEPRELRRAARSNRRGWDVEGVEELGRDVGAGGESEVENHGEGLGWRRNWVEGCGRACGI